MLRAAREELLLPLLRSRIDQRALGPSVPLDVYEFLSAVEELNGERNSSILKEAKLAARLLNQAGIEPVFLKGVAYLSIAVYPDPATRYVGDIDLLVSEAEMKTAVDLLAQNGYETDNSDRFGHFRHHHPPMRRPGAACIEIHHTLCLGRCGLLLPASELIAKSILYDWDGVRVRVPCPEDLLTHLVVHSQLRHPYNERIWPPLRTMYDLYLVLRRFGNVIDWNSIENRFRRAGKYGVLVLHLSQVSESLGFKVPFQFHMNAVTRLQRFRRRFLRRIPALRYGDPIYMFSAVLIRRLHLLRRILSTPNGVSYLVRQLLTPGVYQRLAADLIEGRGR
jgi:hypothetical protein